MGSQSSSTLQRWTAENLAHTLNLEFGSSEGMQWSECDAEEEDTPEAPKQGGTYPPDVFPAAANSSMLLQQNIPVIKDPEVTDKNPGEAHPSLHPSTTIKEASYNCLRRDFKHFPCHCCYCGIGCLSKIFFIFQHS